MEQFNKNCICQINAYLWYCVVFDRVSDGRAVSIDDTVNVTITILDSNEPPTFPEESISQNVLESTTEGKLKKTTKSLRLCSNCNEIHLVILSWGVINEGLQ